MERIGIFFKLKPGSIDEYRIRHDNIWPEMVEILNRAGIHNYSIWNLEDMLFAYFETGDYGKSQEILRKEPVYNRWREYMEDIIYIENETGQKEWPMEMVFFHQ